MKALLFLLMLSSNPMVAYDTQATEITHKKTEPIKHNIYSGQASWYGKQFHGKRTASGEKFNMYENTAASLKHPINSLVKVVNLENGKEIIVRINDKGPFTKNRVIDLSYAAAKHLDFINKGTTKVKVSLYKENILGKVDG